MSKIEYSESKDWDLRIHRQFVKRLSALPNRVNELFRELTRDLEVVGPIQHEWPNYSKLSDRRYHCHLNYRYVAVWESVDDRLRVLEVNYVGSRENAPY